MVEEFASVGVVDAADSSSNDTSSRDLPLQMLVMYVEREMPMPIASGRGHQVVPE